MINRIQISFQSNIPKNIPPIYSTPYSKSNTVAILGSSKETPDIMKYMDMCSVATKDIVLSGRNIVSGCGTVGIMGRAYESGRKYSKLDEQGKPAQNLSIVMEPLWGDEDLENCIPLKRAYSEAERVEDFAQVADTVVIFPGSAYTLQEASTLIAKNYYGKPEDKKKIIFVGKEFFEGLDLQYEQLYKSGLISCKPEELYTIVDSKEEIMAMIDLDKLDE